MVPGRGFQTRHSVLFMLFLCIMDSSWHFQTQNQGLSIKWHKASKLLTKSSIGWDSIFETAEMYTHNKHMGLTPNPSQGPIYLTHLSIYYIFILFSSKEHNLTLFPPLSFCPHNDSLRLVMPVGIWNQLKSWLFNWCYTAAWLINIPAIICQRIVNIHYWKSSSLLWGRDWMAQAADSSQHSFTSVLLNCETIDACCWGGICDWMPRV